MDELTTARGPESDEAGAGAGGGDTAKKKSKSRRRRKKSSSRKATGTSETTQGATTVAEPGVEADGTVDVPATPSEPAEATPDNLVPAGGGKKKRRRRSKKATGGKKTAEVGDEPSATAAVDDDDASRPSADDEAGSVENGESSGGRRRRVPDLKARSRERADRSRPSASEAVEPAEDAADADRAAEPGEAAAEPVEKPRRKTDNSKPRGKADKKWEEIFAGKTFRQLGLRGSILKSLDAAGFEAPTKIQAELIPLALTGKDILGQSRTGSGKTAAFGLPVVNNCVRGIEFQAIILAPTRELAIQITDELASLARYTPLNFATVYGGQKIETQASRLAKRPEVVVATPGRLMDMMNRGHIHLGNVRFAVLDEVDRMLDIGFRDDIKKILGAIRSTEHQTMFVSATISDEIESLGRTFMQKDAERLVTTGGSLTVSLVDQRYISVEPWDKPRLLTHVVNYEKPELALVFCRMKRTVDKITNGLKKDGINAEAIHGDLPQGKRNSIMKQLRAGKLHVLVASDLAARGIDVDGITHVINFDLPEDPEIYVHRIGRTARAGRGGVAFSFVSPDQGPLLTQVEKLANTHIPAYETHGFDPGPVPSDIEKERVTQEKRRETLKSMNRYTASRPELPAESGALDPAKFPGGIVPTKLPKRRLGGKMKTSRVIKLEAAQKMSKDEDA